jgi:hypothetical protein
LVFGWFDMAEQLKGCLIVHAASIFTKPLKVNGFGSGSALWIGKPADWIFDKKLISLWIKKAPLWSGQRRSRISIMKNGQRPCA